MLFFNLARIRGKSINDKLTPTAAQHRLDLKEHANLSDSQILPKAQSKNRFAGLFQY